MSEPNLDAEAEALLAEIRVAFRGVSREGGLSWHEAVETDRYANEEELAAAQAEDTDSAWLDLAYDPNWSMERAWYAFIYLDPIGFRYYLAASMTAGLLGRDVNNWLSERLTLEAPLESFENLWSPDNASGKVDFRELRLEQWALLNTRQRHCVRRFLEFKVKSDNVEKIDSFHTWEAALGLPPGSEDIIK